MPLFEDWQSQESSTTWHLTTPTIKNFFTLIQYIRGFPPFPPLPFPLFLFPFPFSVCIWYWRSNPGLVHARQVLYVQLSYMHDPTSEFKSVRVTSCIRQYAAGRHHVHPDAKCSAVVVVSLRGSKAITSMDFSIFGPLSCAGPLCDSLAAPSSCPQFLP